MIGKVGHLKRDIKETELLLCFYLDSNEILLSPSMSCSPDRRREVRGFLFRDVLLQQWSCLRVASPFTMSRFDVTLCYYLTSLSGDVSRLGQDPRWRK